MKSLVLLFINLLCFTPFESIAGEADSTKGRLGSLSIEFQVASRFYDLHSVDKYRYRRAKQGVSVGLLIRVPLKKNFYFSFGGFYSQSTFLWDTTGIFPSGIQFASPLALEKKYVYLDKIVFIGKDFSLCKGKWVTGISVGLARSSLLKGKQYIQGVEISPSSIFANSLPQFRSRLGSLLFNWNISYKLGSNITVQGNVYRRWYGMIDESNANNYNKTTGQPKIFGERMWNYGIGIRYNFLDCEKAKNWFEKKK